MIPFARVMADLDKRRQRVCADGVGDVAEMRPVLVDKVDGGRDAAVPRVVDEQHAADAQQQVGVEHIHERVVKEVHAIDEDCVVQRRAAVPHLSEQPRQRGVRLFFDEPVPVREARAREVCQRRRRPLRGLKGVNARQLRRRRRAAVLERLADGQRRQPVGAANFVTSYGVRWGDISAAVCLSILPPLVFATAAQKYLVKGLSSGAVKG